MKLKIMTIQSVGTNLKLIRLDLAEQQFNFNPGQAVGVIVHDSTKWVEQQKRYYSIASSPSQKAYLELLLKDNLESQVGHYLFTHLKEGESLEIVGPYGNACLKEDTPLQNLTLLGAGSGIAPLMSILRSCVEQGIYVTLFYSTKTKQEIIYKKELEDLQKNKKIRYIHTLTKESWEGNTGRITKEFLEKYLLSQEGLFFICGSKEMIEDTVANLIVLGISEESIILEKY